MFSVKYHRNRGFLFLYAGSKLLHFSFPCVNRRSLQKFRAPTLKPKNCLVFNFPLTGILSTAYLFRRTDGTVSTPLRIRPIKVLVSSSISSTDPRLRLLDLKGISRLAVLSFIFGLHWLWYGQPSH